MDGTLIDSVGVWNQVDLRLIQTLGGPAMAEGDVQQRRERFLKEHRDAEKPYLSYCEELGKRMPLHGRPKTFCRSVTA